MSAVRDHVACILSEEMQPRSRRSQLILDKGSVPFRAHLAKIAGGAEAPVRRKTAVVVGGGERARVRCHPHLTRPGEGSERIG